MKRWLITIAILLLAGAVVNVAVAWAAILLPDKWDWTYENITYPRVEWPRDAPDGWPQPDRIHGWKAFGFLRRYYEARVRDGKDRRARYINSTTRAGWPRLSLEWEIWETYSTPVPPDGWNQKLPEQTHWRSGLPVPSKRLAFILEGWERLPVRPVWLGLAVNTLFYAAILWLLLHDASVLRRLVRARRGLCLGCGYPMGESPVCSECGKPLPQRAVAET